MALKSVLGDGEIMQRTVIQPDNRLRFEFGDGETITSDPIPPDKRKAGVLTAWCEAVRARDIAIQQAKHEEAMARKKRRQAEAAEGMEPYRAPEAEPAEASPTALYAEASATLEPAAPGPSDPEGWIRMNLEKAEREYREAEQRYETTKVLVDKWRRLAQALDEQA